MSACVQNGGNLRFIVRIVLAMFASIHYKKRRKFVWRECRAEVARGTAFAPAGSDRPRRTAPLRHLSAYERGAVPKVAIAGA